MVDLSMGMKKLQDLSALTGFVQMHRGGKGGEGVGVSQNARRKLRKIK